MNAKQKSVQFQRITPCLWFDSQAEDAANFYVGIFPNSGITRVSRYAKAGHETHGMVEGSVMTVLFELDGQRFTALNGGPHFKFSEAISLQIGCATQQEVDYYWSRLADGGEEGPCGWLKDRFGLSWQVVPDALLRLLADPDVEKTERVTQAFMQMGKLDIATLERAHRGDGA
jgi:predicted 3-demethylubiquinone-9 3-methyltransferase (glyoxalase superfamily)